MNCSIASFRACSVGTLLISSQIRRRRNRWRRFEPKTRRRPPDVDLLHITGVSEDDGLPVATGFAVTRYVIAL
jgi:hypothetical protein